LTDCNPLLDIAVEHESYEVDAFFAHDPWNSQVVIHDLVYAIERVFFVDDGVQQDAKGPYILFFATVGAAGEYFRGCVICYDLSGVVKEDGSRGQTNSAYKDVKRPALDVRCTSKVDELDVALAIQYHVFIFNVAMHDLGFGV
jgi:hypothetical protein